MRPRGIIKHMVCLDNGISQQMIPEFERQELDYQLASVGDNWVVKIEKANALCINHSIVIRSWPDNGFSSKGGSNLILHLTISKQKERLMINTVLSLYSGDKGKPRFWTISPNIISL